MWLQTTLIQLKVTVKVSMERTMSQMKGGVQTNVWDLKRHGRVEEICTYANLPLLLELLQGIPATEPQNVLFMHDGAPPHFSIAVRNYNGTYPGKWTGRGGPIA
ncbi:hypothetical protein TNCV_2703891 [Trichonephila clavipes]|nr:hypothetical protein TNCV_2703891 [Trichonephila clavipes]